ncbi:breast cancer metastasis-suppressor 1-like protein isoform X2 [Dinothrombium tinctorium]|uniref:Breast cancer metastasis-suppressor 1-like protein isoform X2 n=1 Tax=Dinothrombium tinctorium TaxID=1965070 RepID=A0A443RPC4_9ACAR|nr:breast cancer metastasis-suppressor 1-like protein isoform X2 [Dinothrombium tinctorium]
MDSEGLNGKRNGVLTRNGSGVNQTSSQELDEAIDREESPESDKCAHFSNDDSDSEFGASASEEESSDIDEEEYERRRNMFFAEMADLEKQFLALKEQLYAERLTQIDRKFEEVKAGRAQEYLQPLEELQEHMRTRTEVAGILKKFKLANAECQYNAEILAAKQHLEVSMHCVDVASSVALKLTFKNIHSQSETQILKEQIRQDLEDKVKRLEEDKNSVDSDFWTESSITKKRKKYGNITSNGYEYGPGRDQLNLPDRRRKPVTVSGPYIVYMLKDADIIEDWTSIRKAIKASTSVSYF